MEMSEHQSKIRLGELRATRECNELKEKHTYLSRLLKQQNDQVKLLEEQVATFESRLAKREEEFRR